MGLEEYKKKRDFKRTPEPAGGVEKSPTGGLYIIQKHAASRLHYDLRLELNGALKSWAVPKGPSLVPGEKRLAVQVEDHPIEYGSFEGIIPEGEYGGGTVMLWDRGTWEPIGDPLQGYERGDFKFTLRGEKLKGAWVLARMKGRAQEGEGKNWLLIKKHDEAAISKFDPEPVETMNLSVASGRSMEQIASERENFRHEGGAVHRIAVPPEVSGPVKRKPGNSKGKISVDASVLTGARRAGLNGDTFRPELATLVGKPPVGDRWIHEVKYDGYRILCVLERGRARLYSRNGREWTDRFPEIAEAASKLPLETAVIDGEIVVVDEEGKTNFQALQNMLQGVRKGSLAYFVFDMVYCNGYDLARSPLLERKELLGRTIPAGGREIIYADHIRGQGGEVFEQACRLSLEGIVSKQADSPYEANRSRGWVKAKCVQRQEFVVGGYTDRGGARTGFGALLLGYYGRDGRLVYAGKVGTGFSGTILEKLCRRLESMQAGAPSFMNPPTGREAKGVHWIRPELVCEVEFSEWTGEGMLRHPSFKGIREDKDPKEVVRETVQSEISDSAPAEEERAPGNPSEASAAGKRNAAKKTDATPAASRRKPAKTDAGGSNSNRVDGSRIVLTNPERILYPEMGVTKRDLAQYYSEIADWILPHLAGRPLSLVRCPEGRERECFYQKHLGGTVPEQLRAIPIMEKDGREFYRVTESIDGVIALVQIGVLEIHVWGSREGRLEQPDLMVFDLDPAPEVPWAKMTEAAFGLRDKLSELGLVSFLKTTGGKGLHVAVPLVPDAGWDEVKAFSKAVAEDMVRESPGRYTATMSKAKREGKIFIDYLRNGRGATSIAAYSTRSRPNAPVSTPIAWDELTGDIRPDGFTIRNIRQRLKSLGQDPWKDYFGVRQAISREFLKDSGV